MASEKEDKIMVAMKVVLARLDELERLQKENQRVHEENSQLQRQNLDLLRENQEVARNFNQHVWLLEALGKVMKKTLPLAWFSASPAIEDC
jgi:FtsZ-binding cell division protein ZapB